VIDDDGPGIPEDELNRVFEPFYRVEGSRNRDTGGVGLGLAIAQATVAALNGTLTLANRAPGGLRALIVLPRRRQ
jgi:signal transduction histidine kinase